MFVVITASNLPDHVRGYVSRFLVEVDQGVYVGTVSRRVRDNLWRRCGQALKGGRRTMINSDPTWEQGYAVNTMGTQRRVIRDFDGLLLPEVLSRVAGENSTPSR